jgi:hypothetical protein
MPNAIHAIDAKISAKVAHNGTSRFMIPSFLNLYFITFAIQAVINI